MSTSLSPVLWFVPFLLWVNAIPPLVSLVFGDRWNRPLDGGRLWRDQQPIFGSHKTIRGIVASLLGGIVVAPLVGLPWWIGAGLAGLAMSGDLLSSFIKRRSVLASGTEIVILDQLFESLLPLLLLVALRLLSWWQAIIILSAFIAIAYWSSRFWLFILYRSPLESYPRPLRSAVRLREWKACHTPLAHWQTLFNLTSFLSDAVMLTSAFKLFGLYDQGKKNALQIEIVRKTFYLTNLPLSFEGFRILLMTDLHLDGQDDLTSTLIERLQGLEVDLCLIGGDIRMQTYGPIAPCLEQLCRLLPSVHSQHGILGVLGNHDCLEMAPECEELGLIMLINEAWPIDRYGERIWIVGVDDPHYYKPADAASAYQTVPPQAFTIFLAHSPEAYREAAAQQAQLYLCGHTHGGQIRLPDPLYQGPLLTNSRAPRYTAAGAWQYQEMQGYTSRGAEGSGIPLRFHCSGEITLITLARSGAKLVNPPA